jgi:hypothetical protein
VHHILPDRAAKVCEKWLFITCAVLATTACAATCHLRVQMDFLHVLIYALAVH